MDRPKELEHSMTKPRWSSGASSLAGRRRSRGLPARAEFARRDCGCRDLARIASPADSCGTK